MLATLTCMEVGASGGILYQNAVISNSLANSACHVYNYVDVASGNLSLPRLVAVSFVNFVSRLRKVIL